MGKPGLRKTNENKTWMIHNIHDSILWLCQLLFTSCKMYEHIKMSRNKTENGLLIHKLLEISNTSPSK